MTSHRGTPPADQSTHLPAPSIWPVTLALGVTFAAAGLITNLFVLASGGVIALAGLVGWIAQLTEGKESR